MKSYLCRHIFFEGQAGRGEEGAFGKVLQRTGRLTI